MTSCNSVESHSTCLVEKEPEFYVAVTQDVGIRSYSAFISVDNILNYAGLILFLKVECIKFDAEKCSYFLCLFEVGFRCTVRTVGDVVDHKPGRHLIALLQQKIRCYSAIDSS